jgi:hypothetical protein
MKNGIQGVVWWREFGDYPNPWRSRFMVDSGIAERLWCETCKLMGTK